MDKFEALKSQNITSLDWMVPIFYEFLCFQNFELSTIVMLPSGPHKLELRSTNGPAVPENDLESRNCARSTHKKEEEEERRINEQLF